MICFGGRIFSFRNSEEWFDLVDRINRFDNQGSRFVGIPGGRNHYFAEIYPREWLFRTVPALFEGQELPVPESCDLYLGKLYGDYMTIPQEEDREHHFIRSVSLRQGV